MSERQNPYEAPVAEESSVMETPVPAGSRLRLIIWCQVLATIFCVVVGNSEVNELFRWGQPLIPLVPFISLLQIVGPLRVMFCQCDAAVKVFALCISIAMVLTGLWAIIPLVQ